MSLEQINSTICRINLRNAAQAIEKGDAQNASLFMLEAFNHAFKPIRPSAIAASHIDDDIIRHLNELNQRISLLSYGVKMTEYDRFRLTVHDPHVRQNVQSRNQLQWAFRFVVSVIAAIEGEHNLDAKD
jgi:hypothetical protein